MPWTEPFFLCGFAPYWRFFSTVHVFSWTHLPVLFLLLSVSVSIQNPPVICCSQIFLFQCQAWDPSSDAKQEKIMTFSIWPLRSLRRCAATGKVQLWNNLLLSALLCILFTHGSTHPFPSQPFMPLNKTRGLIPLYFYFFFNALCRQLCLPSFQQFWDTEIWPGPTISWHRMCPCNFFQANFSWQSQQ